MIYYIYYTNSIFKVKERASESEPYDLGTLSVEYADGYVECRFDFHNYDFRASDTSCFKFMNYEAKKIVRGRIRHQHGFGEVWELLLKIRLRGEQDFHQVIFKGGEYTNSFSPMSIAHFIIKTLNEVQHFESIDDFNDYTIINQDNTNRELEDEILALGKVIALCKKYEELDPVFPYQPRLREWIRNRIHRILQSRQ